MKKALGRGLNALIPDEGEEILHIDIDRIIPNPDQPRKVFDEDAIKGLASSIEEKGILQPVIVSRTGTGSFMLIAGERRWRASLSAGLRKIPCIVRSRDEDDSLEVSLIENIQRENLNPLEMARAFQRLIDTCSLKQEEVAHKVGKDRATIANYLRLLNLPEDVKELLAAGRLTMGHARAVLSLEDADARSRAARKVIEEDLSVRQTEELCKNTQPPAEGKAKKEIPRDPHLDSLENELATTLGTKVRIAQKGKKGKIEIEYYSLDELNRLIDILRI